MLSIIHTHAAPALNFFRLDKFCILFRYQLLCLYYIGSLFFPQAKFISQRMKQILQGFPGTLLCILYTFKQNPDSAGLIYEQKKMKNFLHLFLIHIFY